MSNLEVLTSSCAGQRVSDLILAALMLYWSSEVPAHFRFREGVRPRSGGRHFVGFPKVGRPLRLPCRGAAAGETVLPHRNQRNVAPPDPGRAPPGPSGPLFSKINKMHANMHPSR